MSEPVLRVIRLREALAMAERERDEARADRLDKMYENQRLKQRNGALCVKLALAEQATSAAAALLREAAEVIEKLNDRPRYWDGFYESSRALIARIKEAIHEA